MLSFLTQRVVPAPVTFVIAGLVKGVSEEPGWVTVPGSYPRMRRHFVRWCWCCRRRRDSCHWTWIPSPDIEVVETELTPDLQTLKVGHERTNKARKPVYDAALRAQQRSTPARRHRRGGGCAAALRELNLLTTKFSSCMFNATRRCSPTRRESVSCARRRLPMRCSDAAIESELTELDDESAAELLESIGSGSGMDALARWFSHPESCRP